MASRLFDPALVGGSEQALDFIENILESSTEYSIIGKDLQGRILLWNEGARRLYGYEPEEVVGRLNSSILHTREDVQAGKCQEILQAALRDGKWEGAVDRVRKTGEQFKARVVITPRYDRSGQPTGFLLISKDIADEIRAAERIRRLNEDLVRNTAQLEIRNKELEAFTYSVSHDLRAPLRQIDGFSKILLEEFGPRLDATAQRYLQRVREGAGMMGRLVDDLLNLARVGRQDLRVQITGLKSLVEEVVADLEPETVGRKIEWRIGQLPYVECDPALMKVVIVNLLSNAVKYTRPRELAVIEVGATEQDGQAAIFVRDNGVGFNMKYADKLFGVFQRLHRAQDFEGTGVGLATVQRVIHKHGGRIWAESELDKGASFYFTLGTTKSEKQGG